MILYFLLLNLCLWSANAGTQKITTDIRDDIGTFAPASYLREQRSGVASLGETAVDTVRRSLSLAKDWFTGESTRTENGVVPRTSCRKGYYRPSGGTHLTSVTALRADGCMPCPRGKYGDEEGKEDASCSGNCPLGKFSTQLALTDIELCKMCPMGRYGAITGNTNILCRYVEIWLFLYIVSSSITPCQC